LQFRLLGAVEMWSRERRIELGPTKAQLLLAVLLLEAGRTVPFDTMVTRVWGESIPAKINVTVQANLSRLRRRLEDGDDDRIALEHVPAVGYRLTVPAECVDALEFSRLVAQGQASAHNGDREHAINLLRSAEALVTGEPLAGLPGEWAQAARSGLQERLRTATATRIGLQLESGAPHALIPELRELTTRHPHDEALAALHMRALHAAGRSVDALDVYAAIRRRLHDELGMEPHQPLREIQQLVLRTDPTRTPSSPAQRSDNQPTVTPDTLEHDPPGFVGRQRDLALLARGVTTQLDTGQLALCVIDGMPGVGKSTFAVHLAHRLRSRCPDGTLQLHLRAHDPHVPPTTPQAALDLLLTTLGVEPRRLQHEANLDRAIALWRRHTGARRLLLVLDDAADAEQVRPLLPSGHGSLVIITSRHPIADLPGAVHHTLPLMSDEDARTLFTTAAKAAIAETDTDALHAIITACGQLPLALAIAGAYWRMHPSWRITDLADRLTRSLTSQDSDTLRARLNAAFETSYRDLPELPRRALRRLALHPSVRITLQAAAALADADPMHAESALELLVEHHLLHEPQRHIYRLHDLARGFASHAVARDDSAETRHEAEERLVTVTLATIEQATARLHPHHQINLAARDAPMPAPTVGPFPDAQHAATWLDAEQASLRTVIDYWHAHARPIAAAAAAHLLAIYLDRRGLWKESAPLHENALQTWVQRNDALGQACALTDLAMARWRLGSLDQARYYAETALGLWQQLNDQAGQADALLQLGRARHYAHQTPAAISCYRRCATLRGALGDKHGQTVALYHLGTALFDHGEYTEGIRHTQRALELARQTHDDAVERNCLNNLGDIAKHREDHDSAREHYEQALQIALRLGDTHNIAVAKLNLGDIHVAAQRAETAMPLLNAAQSTFHKLDHRSLEIITLATLCRAYHQLARHTDADEALRLANNLARQWPDPSASTIVRLTEGFLHRNCGDLTAAVAAYTDAAALALSARAPLEQAAALRGMGDCLHASGDERAARTHWSDALQLYAPLNGRQVHALRDKLRAPTMP
jgi:DNA-binding SARP family transcriptional activator/tetratricopeptide (TPR) repeat protein